MIAALARWLGVRVVFFERRQVIRRQAHLGPQMRELRGNRERRNSQVEAKLEAVNGKLAEVNTRLDMIRFDLGHALDDIGNICAPRKQKQQDND